MWKSKLRVDCVSHLPVQRQVIGGGSPPMPFVPSLLPFLHLTAWASPTKTFSTSHTQKFLHQCHLYQASFPEPTFLSLTHTYFPPMTSVPECDVRNFRHKRMLNIFVQKNDMNECFNTYLYWQLYKYSNSFHTVITNKCLCTCISRFDKIWYEQTKLRWSCSQGKRQLSFALIALFCHSPHGCWLD